MHALRVAHNLCAGHFRDPLIKTISCNAQVLSRLLILARRARTSTWRSQHAQHEGADVASSRRPCGLCARLVLPCSLHATRQASVEGWTTLIEAQEFVFLPWVLPNRQFSYQDTMRQHLYGIV